MSVLDLFAMVRDLVKATGVEPNHTAPRPGDVQHSFADISWAHKFLGYEPKWSLRGGLAKTVEYFSQLQ